MRQRTAERSGEPGIVFDFLAETGMFKYPCNTRQHMVSDLIDRTRAQEKEIARLQGELENAKTNLRRVSPRSSQSLKNPARATSRIPSVSPVSSTLKKEIVSTPGKLQFRFIQKLPKV